MLFWLPMFLAFITGMFVVLGFSVIWKDAYNKMCTPSASTNNARVKCPCCGKDISITVTSPIT